MITIKLIKEVYHRGIDEYIKSMEWAKHGLSVYRKHIQFLLKAAKENEKDAARYRWLRHGDNDELVLRQFDGSRIDPDALNSYLLRNEELDTAIGAQMKEGNDGNPES